MDSADQDEAREIADRLARTGDPRAFTAAWDTLAAAVRVRVVRVLAARVATAAPDGVHHPEYRTIDPDLDAVIVGLVECARHRLPERGRHAREALRQLGARGHNAPWRLAQILRAHRR